MVARQPSLTTFPLNLKTLRRYRLCASHNIELVVVGPEAPLVAGVADVIRAAGIAVFGPGAQGARLEGSKTYSKHFMAPMASPRRATKALPRRIRLTHTARAGCLHCVKADGLAAGKGVVVAERYGMSP